MSAICSACEKSCEGSSDVFKCTGCTRSFHQKCAVNKFPEGVVTRGAKKEWFCGDCKKTKIVTPTSSKSDEQGTVLTKECMMELLESFKHEIFNELKSHSSQFQEFKLSLEFFSAKLDESNQTMEIIKEQNKEILKENSILKQEKLILHERVGALETKVRELEQYSRRNNIEINGIPKTPGENELDILRDIGRVIGEEVEARDVVAVHRVPAYNKARTPALIARFTTRQQRDTWLAKYRQQKPILANSINNSFPATKVYIGEHLTPDNKILLAKLKEECKAENVQFVWCREGKFYVRKSEEHRGVRVNGVEEIKKIKW